MRKVAKMHIFVTGATGWIGGALAGMLLDAGHGVTGLVRDPEKAKALVTRGLRPLVGTLDEHAKLYAAAAEADAVVHLAFNHDFSQFAKNAEQDRRAIEAMGEALVGSPRPMLVTTGLLGLPRQAQEKDLGPQNNPRHSESTARALLAKGVRAATVRLPPSVHGIGDHGFLPIIIAAARQHGVSGYLGDGNNCWGGVHRDDAARVFLLALEQGAREPIYHAVAETGVPFRDIASVVGRRLGLPVREVQPDHFGWFAKMAQGELSAVSEQTRAKLGWSPKQVGLLADLDQSEYFSAL